MPTISIEETVVGLNQYKTKFSPIIQAKLRTGLEFETLLPWQSTDRLYTGQEIEVTGGLQPYQPGFTPNGGESYDGIDNFVRPLKVDKEFTAEQLEKFYDGWMANWFTPGSTDIQRGYTSYIMNMQLIPLLMEELNQVSWAGEYATPTPGTPGAMLTSVDGFAKNLATQITAGRITVIPTGVLVDSTIDEQIRQDFCNEIPMPYRYLDGMIFMSKTKAQAYSNAYKEKHSSWTNDAAKPDGLYVRVDDYNKIIVGLTAMEGSDRIICVFNNKPSMICIDRTGFPRYFNFRFQEFNRTVKVMAEIYRGYGFETGLHLFVNDQE